MNKLDPFLSVDDSHFRKKKYDKNTFDVRINPRPLFSLSLSLCVERIKIFVCKIMFYVVLSDRLLLMVYIYQEKERFTCNTFCRILRLFRCRNTRYVKKKPNFKTIFAGREGTQSILPMYYTWISLSML